MDSFPESIKPEEQRTDFIGRVQEQRQFLMVLGGLLAHHYSWFKLARDHGDDCLTQAAPQVVRLDNERRTPLRRAQV